VASIEQDLTPDMAVSQPHVRQFGGWSFCVAHSPRHSMWVQVFVYQAELCARLLKGAVLCVVHIPYMDSNGKDCYMNLKK